MKKFYIETYGCQMNVADSEVVAAILETTDAKLTETIDEADIILLNTCSIRDNAEQKVIHRLQALKTKAIVGVIGCMAERMGQELIDEYGLKQDELARRIAKSRTAVTNSLRLLKLDERVQAMLMDGSLSEGHARTLLALNDKKQQNDLAQEIRDKALSVRETERLIRRLAAKEAEKKEPAPVWRDQTAYDELVMSLRRSLGTKVSIRRTEQEKGQLVIDYYSVEDLERITEKLK